MSYTAAVEILARAAGDAERVAGALCTLATLAHIAGDVRRRDDSVDTAADLLAQSRRFALRNQRRFAGQQLAS